MIQPFVADFGDGDLGKTTQREGRTLRRSAELHTRRYVSIFGELKIERFVYDVRPKQKIEVATVDEQRGLPMRRPLEARIGHTKRRGKSEKKNKKQRPYVGAVYTITPFCRTPEEVIDEVCRKACAQDRPKPKHKRVWVEMTQHREDALANGKTRLFAQLGVEVKQRDIDQNK